MTKAGISYFLKTYKKTGSIARQPGSGGKEKKTEAVLKFIDSVMEKDDETSLADLKSQLQKEGTSVSTSTVHRWRQDLGWTSKYQILSNDSRGERREALGMGTEECGRH